MRLRLALALFLVAGACGDDSTGAATTTTTAAIGTTTSTAPPSAAPTLWGFSPFPTQPDFSGLIDAYRIANDHGDLIAHQLDECVPWEALRTGGELPYDHDDQLAVRAQHTPFDSVVYVAASLTSVTRDAVASDCGGPGGDRSFTDPVIRESAKGWIDLLVARLDPEYLNVGVEFTLFARHRPDEAEAFESLIVELVDHVHAQHPGVVVLASAQFDTHADVSAVEAVAAAVDVLGISIYPSAYGATAVPADDVFEGLAALGKPLAIAETGWPGGSTTIDGATVPFTEEGQVEYVEWLGRVAERHDMAFVVWFYPGDPGPVLANVPADLSATAQLFATMGLVAEDRTERPALEVWDRLREG
jgi:hypothetical protein